MGDSYMDHEQFEFELRQRGFTLLPDLNRWVGPFGLSVPGDSLLLNPEIQGDYTRQAGRWNTIRDLDIKLRARRGVPKPKPWVGPSLGFDIDRSKGPDGAGSFNTDTPGQR